MSTAKPGPTRDEVAKVDYLVDENGARIDVPDDAGLKIATEVEQTVGATGPTNWWRMGIVALLAVIVVLFGLQMLGGNKGTDMVPGTPITAPQTTP